MGALRRRPSVTTRPACHRGSLCSMPSCIPVCLCWSAPGCRMLSCREHRVEEPGETHTCAEQALLHRRHLLEAIGGAQLPIANVIHLWPQMHGLTHPVEDGRLLPGFHLGGARMVEKGGKLGETQLFRLNELLIPDFVQVARCAKPLHLDRVPALIVAPPHMQRLVDVTNEMHQELHGNDFLWWRSVWGTEHPCQTLDGFHHIARGILGRRLVGFVIPDIHIMPGSGMVPRRISADFVRPGTDLSQALWAEQGLELVTGLGREMLFGNASNDTVPDRAPRRGAGSSQQEETNEGRRND